MAPQLRGVDLIREGRGLVGFLMMTIGFLAMVASFTIAGIVQVYLWRIVGLDFMTVKNQYVAFWIFWVWIFGLAVFLPGTLIYLWDFFRLKAVPPENPVATEVNKQTTN